MLLKCYGSVSVILDWVDMMQVIFIVVQLDLLVSHYWNYVV